MSSELTTATAPTTTTIEQENEKNEENLSTTRNPLNAKDEASAVSPKASKQIKEEKEVSKASKMKETRFLDEFQDDDDNNEEEEEEDLLVDEWVFSIPSGPNHPPERMFYLKQVQPPHPEAQRTSTHKKNKKKNNSTSSESDADECREEEEEDEFLLQQRQRRSSGWTFHSPSWTLRSKFILQVTYRPAWQAIPEYTNCSACSSSSTSLLTFGSYCCAGGCGCQVMADRIDFYTHTWTSAEIVNVQPADTPMVIEGIGECQALTVTLQPLSLPDGFPQQTPTPYQEAWQTHAQHLGQGGQPKTTTTIMAPTVIFALPLSQVDPPLLWKVIFPPQPQVSIAVETYTILNASVTATPVSLEPTHIYINGFQSWSFAGSIVRGHEQPQPALPRAFSRAFNLGASPPPPNATHVVSAKAAAAPFATTGTKPEYYQSDFFTCITSDGEALYPKQPLIRSAVETVKRTSSQAFLAATGSSTPAEAPAPTPAAPPQPHLRHHEDPFPFTKLDETGGPAILLGWLAQRQQFGIITADKDLKQFHMHASADGTIVADAARPQETDWAYAQLISRHSYDEEPMVHYLHAVAAHNHARPLQNGDLLTGWCSWYHYYNDISEMNLQDNFKMLEALKGRVPMNAVVVDDGYMTAWGDWDSLKPQKFDHGMAQLANDIQNHGGMRPGLWLAPFAADKHSNVSRDHPDWIVRNEFGAPANSGNCGKFFYGLDASNPAVRNHAHQAIRRAVQDWNYNILKIDFLYAACLEGNGKFDLSMTRAQAMHLALDTIRQAAGPNVFLIGCGCPLATAIGYVDGMRISADTGPTWYPAPPLPWWDHGTLPCLRSMVRNSISRAPLGHRWWHNDPDCLLLGESTRLTNVEVASAASVVAMTCGMMLLSDDLTKVPLTRMRILTKIFPMTGSSAVVLDLHSTNDGLPSLLRLWATDKHDHHSATIPVTMTTEIPRNERNFEATIYARMASFRLDESVPPPNERKRSCIYAPKGLGSWTIVSISNWSDKPAVLHVPPPALLPPPLTGFDENEADTFLDNSKNNDDNDDNIENEDHGYHVLAFWSSKYTWLPPQHHHHSPDGEQQHQQPLSRRLEPHETEIFHVKRVSPQVPQYIGSDLHFSCCREVVSFVVAMNTVQLTLKTDYSRVGHVFVFLPVINPSNIRVMVNGEPGRWNAVGNTPQVGENGTPRLVGRVIRIMVVVHAAADATTTNNSNNGKIYIEY